MIIIRLSVWQKIRLLFGWYVQVEVWPHTAQSYAQYVLPPWEEKRVFRSPEHIAHQINKSIEAGATWHISR